MSPKKKPAKPARASKVAARATKPAPRAQQSDLVGVRPLKDQVLIRRLEEREQKVGGIIIPDSAKEKPQKAEVVAVGSGRILQDGTRVPLTLKAGDTVLIGKWSGAEVKLGDAEYVIVRESDVLGILD
jgi:chaperonin GroES